MDDACALGNSRSLPLLGAGSELLEPHEVFPYMTSLGVDPDAWLKPTQRAESTALTAFIRDHVRRSLLSPCRGARRLWDDVVPRRHLPHGR